MGIPSPSWLKIWDDCFHVILLRFSQGLQKKTPHIGDRCGSERDPVMSFDGLWECQFATLKPFPYSEAKCMICIQGFFPVQLTSSDWLSSRVVIPAPRTPVLSDKNKVIDRHYRKLDLASTLFPSVSGGCLASLLGWLHVLCLEWILILLRLSGVVCATVGSRLCLFFSKGIFRFHLFGIKSTF